MLKGMLSDFANNRLAWIDFGLGGRVNFTVLGVLDEGDHVITVKVKVARDFQRDYA